MIKVFLVEDEIIIRNGIKNSINWEMHGYDFVGEASDGELALPMILEKKPDILITDIKMPFMDGLELSEQVKKVLPATKIMILSGYRINMPVKCRKTKKVKSFSFSIRCLQEVCHLENVWSRESNWELKSVQRDIV